MKKISNLRLHLGAHKTATTHLQSIMELLRDDLLKLDIDYIPLSKLRAEKFHRSVSRISKRYSKFPMLARFLFLQNLNKFRQNTKTLVVSEEDLIGGIECFDNNYFYPKMEHRVKVMNAIAPSTKLHIFLGIRSLDTLIPSAYAQKLRNRLVPGGFETIKEKALHRPPSWTNLILRIKALLPTANLTVWRFEDYISNVDQAISLFCGVKLNKFYNIPVPSTTRSPSVYAIAAIEKLNPELTIEHHKAEAQRIIAEDNNVAKFQPFNAWEIQFLRNFYRKDIDELDKKLPGTLVRF